ncbi:MAG: SIMPL domain-containing protein [Candidatus Limnocylindrales bacterium]
MSTTVTIPTPGSRARLVAVGIGVSLILAATSLPSLTPRSTLAVDPSGSAPEHTISVSGTGTVTLKPDVADLHLGVLSTRQSVKAAQADAAAAMTRIIAALKGLGIDDKDIQTSNVSLQPAYDYSSNINPPRITGFQMSNSVTVTVRDLTKLGDAIDNSLAAGATSLDGVAFRVDDQTAAEAQARQAAMAEAKSKAQTLATAAGVSIGGVASISETSAPIPYPIMYSGGAPAAAVDGSKVATPIQAGTTDVTITVAVVYLIS